jgi:iron(III) transport system substrate-binding protein
MFKRTIAPITIALLFVFWLVGCTGTAPEPATPAQESTSAEENDSTEVTTAGEAVGSGTSAIGDNGLPVETEGSLLVYSGRSESLVGPLLERFRAETGIEVEVRYGSTAEMAATILEEGANSPADLYYGQDAGALGALAKAGRFRILPDDILAQVSDARFRSPEGQWVGTSGRARTVVYNTENVSEADLPDDIFGFCDENWRGRVGWAPTNGSFQAFVTALRVVEGEERARQWLECMIANDVQVYAKNTPIVEATGSGEIDAGFVNHYYLFRFLSEDPDFPARNYHLRSGDTGAMVNVAGAGILDTAANPIAAEALIRYMLSQTGQGYFNTETTEYPLSANIELNPLLTPLEGIETPDIDLSNLDDLEGTLQLLQDVGAL